MSADSNQFLRDDRNFILIVELSEEGSWNGSLFHKTCAAGVYFDAPIEMALVVEEICNQTDTPKAFMEDRKFAKTKKGALGVTGPVTKSPHSAVENENRGLFRVCLRHRYNASWQGWMEQIRNNKKTVFHSFLELVEQITMSLQGEVSSRRGLGGRLALTNGRGEVTIGENGAQWYRVPGATYHVTVLYHENHTWQGVVRWLEARECVRFRSFLELAKMTDVPRAIEIECKELQSG